MKYLTILFLLLCFSCSKSNEDQILGVWYFEKIITYNTSDCIINESNPSYNVTFSSQKIETSSSSLDYSIDEDVVTIFAPTPIDFKIEVLTDSDLELRSERTKYIYSR